MKINLLYILIPTAIVGCILIVRELQGKSSYSFVGTAEVEPVLLHLDKDVEVKKVHVVSGSLVNMGDTLAIFERRALDETNLELQADVLELGVDNSGKQAVIAAQILALQTESSRKTAELRSKILAALAQDSIEQAVRTALFSEKMPKISRQVQLEVAAIEQEISLQNNILTTQINRLRAEASSHQASMHTRQAFKEALKQRQLAERERLVLRAPMAGYVDQLTITEGSVVPSYREMMRIFPMQTQKAIGFIHENTDIPFQIGQKVQITSVFRPTMATEGHFVSASPKLVELPVRLRKFVEVRAWGREVTIQMDAPNSYYIGEKLQITIQNAAQ